MRMHSLWITGLSIFTTLDKDFIQDSVSLSEKSLATLLQYSGAMSMEYLQAEAFSFSVEANSF